MTPKFSLSTVVWHKKITRVRAREGNGFSNRCVFLPTEMVHGLFRQALCQTPGLTVFKFADDFSIWHLDMPKVMNTFDDLLAPYLN